MVYFVFDEDVLLDVFCSITDVSNALHKNENLTIKQLSVPFNPSNFKNVISKIKALKIDNNNTYLVYIKNKNIKEIQTIKNDLSVESIYVTGDFDSINKVIGLKNLVSLIWSYSFEQESDDVIENIKKASCEILNGVINSISSL